MTRDKVWQAPAGFGLPAVETQLCEVCGHPHGRGGDLCRECHEYLKAGFGICREAIRAQLAREDK